MQLSQKHTRSPPRSTSQQQPLVDDAGESRSSTEDPSGFQAFDKGYVVSGLLVRHLVTAGQLLRVQTEGRISGEIQSQLILRYRLADGGTTDQALLVNQFSDKWQRISTTVTVPENATSLQRVFLYRRGPSGKVWYGPVRIDRADIPSEGHDVSDRLVGRFPRVSPGRVHLFRYSDDDEPFTGPRVRVQLIWEE